jgi:DNA-binding transcriptional MerR regulator
MQTMRSVEQLAEEVSAWCEDHGIVPANGQAGERLTERNVRYYRTLGLVDPPLAGGGQGYGEKHRLQLVAIKLLQAQGLPLHRIRDLLFGRTVEDLRRLEKEGLAEAESALVPIFRPAQRESWSVTPLDDEFLLISRRGRGVSPELREQLLSALYQVSEEPRRGSGTKKGD